MTARAATQGAEKDVPLDIAYPVSLPQLRLTISLPGAVTQTLPFFWE